MAYAVVLVGRGCGDRYQLGSEGQFPAVRVLAVVLVGIYGRAVGRCVATEALVGVGVGEQYALGVGGRYDDLVLALGVGGVRLEADGPLSVGADVEAVGHLDVVHAVLVGHGHKLKALVCAGGVEVV